MKTLEDKILSRICTSILIDGKDLVTELSTVWKDMYEIDHRPYKTDVLKPKNPYSLMAIELMHEDINQYEKKSKLKIVVDRVSWIRYSAPNLMRKVQESILDIRRKNLTRNEL